MKPSPPKNPAPIRLVNSTLMLISPAAQRNERVPAQDRRVLQRHPQDLAGIRRAEGDLATAGGALEIGEEQTLAGQQFAGEAAEDAAGHARVHVDAVGHIGHRVIFGADFVPAAHRDHNGLHVVADDFVGDHGARLSCAIDDSDGPAGRCRKSATACGAWGAGRAPTTASLCGRWSGRSPSAATSSTPPGSTAWARASACSARRCARAPAAAARRSSRPRFRPRT